MHLPTSRREEDHNESSEHPAGAQVTKLALLTTDSLGVLGGPRSACNAFRHDSVAIGAESASMVAEPLRTKPTDTVPIHFPRLAEQTACATVLGTTALMVSQGSLQAFTAVEVWDWRPRASANRPGPRPGRRLALDA